MNNKNYSNLKPWLPGQSGNPVGRKPGSKNISTLVREMLDEEADDDALAKSRVTELVRGVPMTYSKAVVRVVIHKALSGDMRAIMWLAEQQERDNTTQHVLRQEPIIVSHIKTRHQSAVD